MAKQIIDPEKQYRVTLSAVLEVVPGYFARPHDDVVLKGKVLSTILDKVEKYEEA